MRAARPSARSHIGFRLASEARSPMEQVSAWLSGGYRTLAGGDVEAGTPDANPRPKGTLDSDKGGGSGSGQQEPGAEEGGGVSRKRPRLLTARVGGTIWAAFAATNCCSLVMGFLLMGALYAHQGGGAALVPPPGPAALPPAAGQPSTASPPGPGIRASCTSRS